MTSPEFHAAAVLGCAGTLISPRLYRSVRRPVVPRFVCELIECEIALVVQGIAACAEIDAAVLMQAAE